MLKVEHKMHDNFFYFVDYAIEMRLFSYRSSKIMT